VVLRGGGDREEDPREGAEKLIIVAVNIDKEALERAKEPGTGTTYGVVIE